MSKRQGFACLSLCVDTRKFAYCFLVVFWVLSVMLLVVLSLHCFFFVFFFLLMYELPPNDQTINKSPFTQATYLMVCHKDGIPPTHPGGALNI